MDKTKKGMQKNSSCLKAALLGNGKMAKEIESIALSKQVCIQAKIDVRNMKSSEIEKALDGIDVCIDFTHPDAVLKQVDTLAKLKKNIVIGTTGWDSHLPKIKALVKKNKIGLLYSPNFSIGVFLFLELIKKAGSLFSSFSSYDVSGFEAHHKDKVDTPSGTAIKIGQLLLDEIPRKKSLSFQNKKGADKKSEISFPSLRSGSIPGTHSILFDSLADTVTLTHTARNRSGFAEGALEAALWLNGKQGFFTLQDMFKKVDK